ncbi:MAG: carboxypeptidase-like regulatory domain-containing protein, partial [Tannerellaceae bacterium]|nr:carboxypeptidase-like regulatory domain-containing protein [Tannerellaceae bacterium]
MNIKPAFVFAALVCPLFPAAQTAGTIRGVVTDAASGQPLPYVTVIVSNTATGAATADDGTFIINNVPVGRHTVQAGFIGYETAIVKEIPVGSVREVYLEIKLTEKPMELGEVVVRPKINKAAALNEMATLGARVFSVEEASRYAGGMDDPARLASGFAGVTTEAANNNGISIHGNSPGLLQWRIEGVEISNVNHFADITQAGGGFLSALSSNVVGNSDFFTGAFPAEYGNAVAGVFDMRLRNGNSQKYQHAFQFGIQGIDFASEGPVSKKNNASYIVNYRYSTIGLLEKMSDMEESMNFQDLNFRLNFPTRRAGTFSLWGVGLIDNISTLVDEPAEWKYRDDGIASAAKLASGATGLSHKYLFGNNKTSLHTTLAATLQNTSIDEDIYDLNKNGSPMSDMTSSIANFVLTSSLNHKFSARHTNKTGFTLTNIRYDMKFDYAPLFGDPLESYIDADGSATLVSAYSSSKINIGNSLTLTAGVNAQFLSLSKKAAVEPRVGLRWQASPINSFAIAYGLHSRMEKADAYFVEDANGNQPNRKLGFTKSHHLM